MGKSIISGLLQLEVLDCLYANHPAPLAWYGFVEQFGNLDDPYLIVNIQQLIADGLIMPGAVTLVAGLECIATAKLKLTVSGYHFIAHNPPKYKY